MSDNLYRIVGLDGFMSLLISKKERFVRPVDAWEDSYEGCLLRLLNTEKGTKELIHIVLTEVLKQNRTADNLITNFVRLQRVRYAYYCQSWSEESDSDAMWRIYAYGNQAIQMVSNPKRIKDNIAYELKPTEFYIKKVQYDIRTEEDAKRVLQVGENIATPLYHKREAFEHEHERRVIIRSIQEINLYNSWQINRFRKSYYKKYNEYPLENNNDYRLIENRVYEIYDELVEDQNYKEGTDKERFLPVKNISDYLIGVRVHPLAQEWYVHLVKSICEQYNVNFLGKSKLYQKLEPDDTDSINDRIRPISNEEIDNIIDGNT